MKWFAALFVSAISYLVVPTAHAQTPPPAAIDGVRMCREQNAAQREKMNASADMPPVVKRMGLSLASDTICSCVERQLRAGGGVMVKEREPARLMKANGLCMSAELNATFPAQCVANYRDLLPLMGYPAATDPQLGTICQCASKVMRERLTPDALYEAQMAAFDEYDARQHGSAAAKPSASARPADPFQAWMAELHSCAAATLGQPRKQ